MLRFRRLGNTSTPECAYYYCSHLINVVITGMCCYMLYITKNQRYNQNNQHIFSIAGFETLFELFTRNGGRNGLCVTRKELAADKNWENSVK